jgi:PPP family 3-phenylpropionic acid transporter
MKKRTMLSTDMKRSLILFGIFDAVFWACFAAFLGFMTTYFLECGMSNSVLSLDIAVYMAFSFAGSFFFGSVCDKLGTNKGVFLPLFVLSMALGIFVYFMASRHLLITALLYPFIGFLAAPLGSFMDTWMLRSFDNDSSLYGKARGTGSAGYAVAMLVTGQLVKYVGYIMIPVLTGILAVPVLLIAFFTKEKPIEKSSGTGEKVDFRQLLGVRPFLIMLVVLFFSGVAVSPINSLKIVLLQSVGGDVGILGLDNFLGVLVQAVFIFISGSLSRIPARTRLFLLSLLHLATLLLNGFARNPAWIISGSLLCNAAYGFLLPTTREIVTRSVPRPMVTTANSLSDAIFGSFSGVVSLVYSGFVMDHFGPRSVAFLGAYIMIVPLVITLISALHGPDRQV